MQSVVWVQINFDAAHNPVEGPCPDTSGVHGHRYTIRAYRSAKFAPHSLDDDLLRDALLGIRTELQGTLIDDLMPGVSTYPRGIAAWVLERIPQATRVRVSIHPDEAAEAHR